MAKVNYYERETWCFSFFSERHRLKWPQLFVFRGLMGINAESVSNLFQAPLLIISLDRYTPNSRGSSGIDRRMVVNRKRSIHVVFFFFFFLLYTITRSKSMCTLFNHLRQRGLTLSGPYVRSRAHLDLYKLIDWWNRDGSSRVSYETWPRHSTLDKCSSLEEIIMREYWGFDLSSYHG